MLSSAATLVSAVLRGSAGFLLLDVKAGLAFAARSLVHNTSMLLLAFCAVHAAGNTLFFLGPGPFNAYAAKMSASPIVRGIELYLLLAALCHAGAASFLTVKDGKLSPGKGWAERAKLALTGTLVTAFLVVHVQHFRLGPSAHPLAAGGVRDFYKDVAGVLASPTMAAFYAAGAAGVGAHAWWGWEKAARKLKDGDGKPLGTEGVKGLGAALIGAMTAAFLGVVASAHWGK